MCSTPYAGYTADVLQSAQSLTDHASRPGPSKIEKEDVELAIQMRKRYEFYEPPPRDVSRPHSAWSEARFKAMSVFSKVSMQYLATLAHDLNSQSLPILPETFDVLRLPPPHQRLGEVDFNIVPDTEIVLESGGEDSEDDTSESEQEEVATRSDDGHQRNGPNGAVGADDEDEDMEEVGMAGHDPGPGRELDEDYDE